MILVSEDAALDFERLRNFLGIKSPLAASQAAAAIWTAVQALGNLSVKINEKAIGL